MANPLADLVADLVMGATGTEMTEGEGETLPGRDTEKVMSLHMSVLTNQATFILLLLPLMSVVIRENLKSR